MTARTHDLFAFASLVTVATYYPPASLNLLTLFAAFVGNIIGGLIPDIDQATNRLWDLLPAGDYLGRVFRRIFLKHRTITHSLLGVFLIHKLLLFVLPKLLNTGYLQIDIIYYAIMIGYISHLVADAITKDGLPLLFPLNWKIGFPPISALRVTTGSWVENLVILPAVGFYIFWFIGKNQEAILKIINLVR